MGLKEYKEKRDFRKTPEPKKSRPKKKSDVLIYVIQKHQASHLHYDLRLEEEGVLKSWAIPKSPPLKGCQFYQLFCGHNGTKEWLTGFLSLTSRHPHAIKTLPYFNMSISRE